MMRANKQTLFVIEYVSGTQCTKPPKEAL